MPREKLFRARNTPSSTARIQMSFSPKLKQSCRRQRKVAVLLAINPSLRDRIDLWPPSGGVHFVTAMSSWLITATIGASGGGDEKSSDKFTFRNSKSQMIPRIHYVKPRVCLFRNFRFPARFSAVLEVESKLPRTGHSSASRSNKQSPTQ